MASAVDICNYALSYLGSEAQVADIAPPDGSVEAGYCARFYPLARRELLQMAPWHFALTRKTLSQLSVNPSSTWSFSYAVPNLMIRPIVIPRVMSGRVYPRSEEHYPTRAFNDEESAEFTIEDNVILTHEPEAELIYVQDITDTTTFPPAFITALAYTLAAQLAGPIIRGAAGAEASNEWREAAHAAVLRATAVNANDGVESSEHTPTWLSSR